MSEDRLSRLEDKLDELLKLRNEDHTNIEVIKKELDNLVSTNNTQHEEMAARIGVLEVGNMEHQKIIHRGEGVKWILRGLGAVVVSLISGLAVYFIMR